MSFKKVNEDELKAGLAYPLSTKQLTKGLSAIAQLDELELNFHGQEGTDFTEHFPVTKTEEDEEELISYSTLLTANFQGGTWSLDIYGVKTEVKTKAANALIMKALPEVKKWLNAEREESWLGENHSLTITFSQTSKELGMLEKTASELVDTKILKL